MREHYRLASTAVLGHSFGTLLALEYAIRHPERVSHLILLNPAPASAADFKRLLSKLLEWLARMSDHIRDPGQHRTLLRPADRSPPAAPPRPRPTPPR